MALTIEVVLNDLCCSFVMARYSFGNLCDEGIKGQRLGIPIHSIDQFRGGDYIDLAVENLQGVYRKSALGTLDAKVLVIR